jgi:hypothetical protein
MALSAFIGHGKAADGREAGAQAALQALEKAGRSPVLLGIIISSHSLPFNQVIGGAGALLGDVPLIGFSTSAEITTNGVHQRSVAVALLTGTDISVRSEFFPGFGEESRSVSQKMVQTILPSQPGGTLFLVADGFHGDPKELCQALPEGAFVVAGCLAGGELRQARTYQLGGRQSGYGGLAAAFLSGKIATGVGLGHGWQEVGAYFHITRVRGPWIRSLNNRPTAEIYAQWLGYLPRDWSFPPLNELVRLYPLGIEQGDANSLLIRSAMRMESDGSLRMHTAIPEGAAAHLMVGSAENCLKNAEKAASQALKALGKAKPIFALVLPDISWLQLLETDPGAEISAIRKVLGQHLPILGGYTYGQISNLHHSSELYNQHIEIILFGEPVD